MPVIYFKATLLSGLLALILAVNVAVIGVGGIESASAQAAASEIEVFGVSQQDVDQDGEPDVTTIDAAFITDRDRVLVYDFLGNMEASNRWQEATDFEDDVWVFDAAADGRVELIIRFLRRPDGTVEAWMWDDQDGDGTVRYQPLPNFSIDESENPNVKVIARDGWWTRGTKTNFNIHMIVDGPVQASFMSKPWLKNLSTDGVVDFTVRVRDTDNDGKPDYQWVNAWPDAESGYGIRRTELVVSTEDDEPPITGSIFWPYLGSTIDWDDLRLDREEWLSPDVLSIRQEHSGYNKTYNVSMPPIQMLWHKSSLLYIGEFVASRFNDDNWFTYSIRRVTPNEESVVNFEAPFAFYDLANDDDGYPELSIRFEQYLERDPFPFREANSEPVQIVRYSWDQDNNTTWDFKLGLIGRHEITETVTVDDLTLRTIPPTELPTWVSEREWDGATFVTAEDSGKWTSEGIYEWDQYGYWRDEYVLGLAAERPSIDDLGELLEGQRGEYAFDLHAQPRMYLSPIDRKLHLLGAEGGIWKVDETREIHYANLGGDYLNQWTLFEGGVPTQRITLLLDQVIYERPGLTEIARTDQAPALFTTSPPRTPEEQQELEEQLQRYQPDNAEPWDFAALMAQFEDPHYRIHGAVIEDLRATDQGFRFVVVPQAEPISGVGVSQGTNRSDSDPYLVTFDGSAYREQPLTPPELSLSMRTTQVGRPVEGAPVAILTEATNVGLRDAKGLVLIVEASQNGVSEEIAREAVDVLSGVPTRHVLGWNPPDTGRWEIAARLEDSNGEIVSDGELLALSVTSGDNSPSRLLLLSLGGDRNVVPLFLTAIVSIAITAVVIWLTFRRGGGAVVGFGERD